MVDHDATGTVDFFNDTGGYGFIETPAADEDVFFHMEDLDGPDLQEGQEVAFDIERTEKGPRATNVLRDPGSPADSSGSTIVENVKESVQPLFDSVDISGGDYDPADYDAVGTVDFFNDTGGYGFIETPAVDEDVFFHMEDLDGPDLEEEQVVALGVEFADKGPRTTTLLRDPPSALRDAIEARDDAPSSAGRPTDGADDDSPTTVYTPDDGPTGVTSDDDGSPTKVYASGDNPTKVHAPDDETTRECPGCHTHLPDGDTMNFCPECGAELPP